MDARYWDAAVVVMDHVRSIGCSTKTVRTYDKRICQLADHLDAGGLGFSAETAWAWCDGGGSPPCHAILKERRATVRLMAEAYEKGSVSRSSHSHPGYGCYRELEGWAKDAADGFMDTLPADMTVAYGKTTRANVSEFLLKVGANGDAGPEAITAESVLGYVDADNGAKTTRCAKLCNVRAFLGHLADVGECAPWAALLADDGFARCRELYVRIDGWEDVGAMSPPDTLLAIDGFMALVGEEGYSRTVRTSFRRVLTLLYVALAVNGARYSDRNAELWFDANAARFGKQVHTYRRALFLFEGFLATGELDASSVRGRAGGRVDDFPDWAEDAVTAYLALRAREGCAESTTGCIMRALLRFARYADSHGVAGWDGLTPEVVSAWCLEDPHRTAEGRTCYAAKVRSFLAYLGDEGVVAGTLSLAVCSQSAPRREIVKVIDDEQVRAATDARKAASTPMELRDAAMVAIGLTMGLRAGDVVGLDLADVSWRDSTVTVTQRKTMRQLRLPLTAAAGNAIAAYVRDGRPGRATSTRIFVRHKVPYAPLTKSACRAACARTFGEGVTFHDLRRTYATRMLRGGAGRHDVADALGHADDGTVDEYLSVDDGRMALCAMSLSELGLGAPGHGR